MVDPAGSCAARREGDALVLATPDYAFRLDLADGLRATRWENRLAGRTLDLGGEPEIALDLDAADQRLWIEGWRWKVTTGRDVVDPDAEQGYRDGCFRARFDDSGWNNAILANEHETGEDAWLWARTYLFVPRACEGRPATLVLGGYGIHDYRYCRVFLNGHPIGERRVDGRWTGPTDFAFGAGTAAAAHIRYGLINVIALQLGSQITRTAQLEELDPHGHAHFQGGTSRATLFAQHVVVGNAYRTPRFRVRDVRTAGDGRNAEAIVELVADDGSLAATVTYRIAADEPVIRRSATIANRGDTPVRIMNVRQGRYAASEVSDGERGFPVYLDGAFFVTLAHPSGWAVGRDGAATLAQYPGEKLAPGESFACTEAVLGVAAEGDARPAFLRHVRSRMRRTVRGHDRPYAIFEPFGAWTYDDPDHWFDESEEFVLKNIDDVAAGQRDTGCRFDAYSVDFWVDDRGDLTSFDPVRFPGGLGRIREKLDALGTAPGLWIDSTGAHWSIGKNPAIERTMVYNPSYPAHRFFCRATEPARSAYIEAFRHHVRENGVRLAKFDNGYSYCNNLAHDHLPGIWSTEAIHEAVIAMLRAMDEESPDVFLMLYWGYRSPWWLLWADTLFEPGLAIEASSPAAAPTLHARDGVTQGLDQAQWFCADVPPLGKDSLGVWLSDWWWNSSIGVERWEEGFVMDLCRGSLLAQPWSDRDWLDVAGRRQMAEFIALLRARPECFANPRFVLGNPWRDEPYGYCCAGGDGAFVALHNCTWEDRLLPLRLGPEWGLPAIGEWRIFRRYPHPAELVGDDAGRFGAEAAIALRPFAVALLEIVPANGEPTPGRAFHREPIPRAFAEPSREVPAIASTDPCVEDLPLPLDADRKPEEKPHPRRTLQFTGSIPPCGTTAVFAFTVELFRRGRLVSRRDPGKYLVATARVATAPVEPVPVLGKAGYPSGWQAWRVPLEPADESRPYEFTVTIAADDDVELRARAHVVPIDD